MFIVQSTVTSLRHISSEYKALDLHKFCKQVKIPVVIGNCVSYGATLELFETGAAALLIGIGPGAACTTRGVLGIGVPQVTATIDAAGAAVTDGEYYNALYAPLYAKAIAEIADYAGGTLVP